jgi:uncharacterized protein (UPF0179 family)
MHEGSVRVVEVERRSIPAAVPQKYAIDGSTITFESKRCTDLGCENRIYCFPMSVKDGMKLRITDIIGDLECPNGDNVVLVRLG